MPLLTQHRVLRVRRLQTTQVVEALGLEIDPQIAFSALRVAPALQHQATARRDISPAVARQLPAKVHQRAHHGDIGVMGHQQQPAYVRIRLRFDAIEHSVEQHRPAFLRGIQHIVTQIVVFR